MKRIAYRAGRIVLTTILLTASVSVTEAVTAPPAKAQLCNMTLNLWLPALNGKGYPYFKAQMQGTCTAQSITVIVCAAFWDGSTRDQLATCVKGSCSSCYQITRNKTLVGGCTSNLPYVTKARGYFTDQGVTYFIPPQVGSFAYDPPTGGQVLC